MDIETTTTLSTIAACLCAIVGAYALRKAIKHSRLADTEKQKVLDTAEAILNTLAVQYLMDLTINAVFANTPFEADIEVEFTLNADHTLADYAFNLNGTSYSGTLNMDNLIDELVAALTAAAIEEHVPYNGTDGTMHTFITMPDDTDLGDIDLPKVYE